MIANARDDDSGAEDAGLEAVLEEYLELARLGTTPDADELVRRHPEFEDGIRRILPTLDLLDRARVQYTRAADVTPRRLGDFSLIREVGRGGMGIVYEARQLSLGRQVALKILPECSLLSGKRRERFEREARAAASLSHPHIVPVFSVGEADGVPYMAMQFIPGRTLDAVIEDERAGVGSWPSSVSPSAPSSSRDASSTESSRYKGIARLGRDAARAVELAHREGVLHRDIKPANLILDDDGKIWITDFGLAKVLEEVDLTLSGDIVGTPRYMAPEGLHGWSDQRSDVYGIGVTLYELLTLEPAFPDTSSRAELQRAIAEDDPIRPRRLQSRIPRDLETIVTTAMSKEPERRYRTAAALADDLDRYLAGEPILARPATVLYRIGLFLRRHLVASASAAAVLVVIVSMTAGWIVSLDRSRREAVDSQKSAQRSAERAMAAVEQMLTRVGYERLEDEPGMSELRTELLEDALRFYAELIDEQSRSASLRLQTALTWEKLSKVQALLSQPEAALESAKSGLAILDELVRERPGDLRSVTARVPLLVRVAVSERHLGRVERAEALFRDALAAAEAAPLNLDRSADRSILVTALDGLGEHLALTAHYDLAGPVLERERAVAAEGAARSGYTSDFFDEHLAKALSSLTMVAVEQGKPELALERLEESVTVYDRFVARTDRDQLQRSARASMAGRFSSVLMDLGRPQDAIQRISECVEISRGLMEDYPGVVDHQSLHASNLRCLAEALRQNGEIPRAVELAGESVSRLESCALRVPDNVKIRADLAASRNALGSALQQLSRDQESEASFVAALADYEELCRRSPDNSMMLLHVADTCGRLAAVVRREPERNAEARTYYERAVAASGRVAEASPSFSTLRRLSADLSRLAGHLLKMNDLEGAGTILARCRKTAQELVDLRPDHAKTANTLASIARRQGITAARNHDQAAALRFFEEAVEIRQRIVDRNPDLVTYRGQLGHDLHNLGLQLQSLERFEEALAMQERARDETHLMLESEPNDPTPQGVWIHVQQAIVQMLRHAGREPEMIEALRRARDFPLAPKHYLSLADFALRGATVSDAEKAEAIASLREAIRAGADPKSLDEDRFAPLRGFAPFEELRAR